MKISAIEIRAGNVIEYNGKLWVVLKNEIMQPGKGASVAQVEMRDVVNGTKNNVRFRTQEAVEKAEVFEVEYNYLYNDGENYTFMNNESFDQLIVTKDVIGDPVVFLQDNMTVQIQMHESKALNVTLPETVIMQIAEADPVVKGQTASSSYKPAVLENGARVMVPPFIGAGERIVVRTEDSSYVERAKDK